ncbi:MAG: protein kinase [Planctomycetota bacterium]
MSDPGELLRRALERGLLAPQAAQELSRRCAGMPPAQALEVLRGLLSSRVGADRLAALEAEAQFLAERPDFGAAATAAPGAPPAPPAVPPGPTGAPPRATASFGRPGGVPERMGAYRIERELARGAMGAVYVARHQELDRKVALKVLLGADPVRRERFRTEARLTARLRHPGIVPVHEVGEEQGFAFLVMDLIDGESLHALLAREGKLPPRRAAELLAPLARALSYAHAQGVLHRDLKPANVLLDAQGAPLLTDFGLAREADGEGGLTATGQRLGTPAYMAPEQARGDNDAVERRTDIYALGVVLYEALTGVRPFQDREETAISLLVAITQHTPTPPSRRVSGIDRDLETICLTCLEKDPSRRYPTASALAADLEAWLRGDPIQARRPPWYERGARALRRHRVGAAVALAGLGLVTFAAGAWRARLGEQRLAAALEVEERALSEVTLLRESRWAASDRRARVRAELEEALELDPGRARARGVLARLRLEAGDSAAAAQLLPGATGADARYVAARLAEDRQAWEEACAGYAAAVVAGLGEDAPRRLARCEAEVAAAHAAPFSAEAARWRELQAGAPAAAPLAAIVRERLRRGELGALTHAWAEVHDALGQGTERPLQARLSAEHDRLVRELAPEADPRLRLRAALAGPLLPRPAVVAGLVALAAEPAPGLARAAARAGLLQLDLFELPERRRLPFARWARAAAEVPASDAVGPALTLLEHAARLGPADAPALAELFRASGPLLRDAAAAAVAIAASRTGGLDPAVANQLLAAAQEGEVSGLAARAQAALSILAAATPGELPKDPTPEAVLLARELRLLPGLRAELGRRAGYAAALELAQRGGGPALHLAQAMDAAETGDLAAARAAAQAALAAAPRDVDALTLAAQLAWLAGERAAVQGPTATNPAAQTPTGDPAAQDPAAQDPAAQDPAAQDPAAQDPAAQDAVSLDPERARRARRRLAFTRRFSQLALPAGAGDLRVVVRCGASPRGLVPACERYLGDPRESPGIAVHTHLALRTRFAFDRYREVEVRGHLDGEPSLWVQLHAGNVTGQTTGVLCYLARRWRLTWVRVDESGEQRWQHGTNVYREQLRLGLQRAAISLELDGESLGPRPLTLRRETSGGNLELRYRYGGGVLLGVVVVGRWDEDDPGRPPAPDPAARRAFEASLEPLSGKLPLAARSVPPPANLAALRRDGAELYARTNWGGRDERGDAVWVASLHGDLELRAQLQFEPGSGRHAGLVLFTDDGDRLFFGTGATAQGMSVLLAFGRAFEPHDILHTRPLPRGLGASDPLVLSLQRIGDYVIPRCGLPGQPLEDLLPEPVYFPTSANHVGLFARSGPGGQPVPAAHFSAVELLAPRREAP